MINLLLSAGAVVGSLVLLGSIALGVSVVWFKIVALREARADKAAIDEYHEQGSTETFVKAPATEEGWETWEERQDREFAASALGKWISDKEGPDRWSIEITEEYVRGYQRVCHDFGEKLVELFDTASCKVGGYENPVKRDAAWLLDACKGSWARVKVKADSNLSTDWTPADSRVVRRMLAQATTKRTRKRDLALAR